MLFTKISTGLNPEQSIVAYSHKAAQIREEIARQKCCYQHCHNHRVIEIHQDGCTTQTTQSCQDQSLELCPACKHNQFLNIDIKNLKSQLYKVNVILDRHCNSLDVDYTCNVLSTNYTPPITIPVTINGQDYQSESDHLIAILNLMNIDFYDKRIIKIADLEPEDLTELLVDYTHIFSAMYTHMGAKAFVEWILPIIKECYDQNLELFSEKLLKRITS